MPQMPVSQGVANFQGFGYPSAPGAMFADTMSNLICDAVFSKFEVAQQKLQIEELKRREEERRSADLMAAVKAESKAAFRHHMQQMFGNNMQHNF
jgi:hypothetical protein